VYLIPCCDGTLNLIDNPSPFKSVTTSLLWLNQISRIGYTIVIDGCCYQVEGWSSSFSTPLYSGVDGFYDENIFSEDNCSQCVDLTPCETFIYELSPCDDCCGINGEYELTFGCVGDGFDPSSLIGKYVSINNCCYLVVEYYGTSTSVGIVAVAKFDTCTQCQTYYPCPSVTPSVTPTPTPSVTPSCTCYEWQISGQTGEGNGFDYVDCNGTPHSVDDPNYFSDLNGSIICACDVTTYGEVSATNTFNRCGDCECFTITLDDNDIINSSDGLVYVIQQCCNGELTTTTYDTVNAFDICAQKIISIKIKEGDLLVNAANSTFDSDGFCCSSLKNCSCNSTC
jgi:hypothetical protein